MESPCLEVLKYDWTEHILPRSICHLVFGHRLGSDLGGLLQAK